MLGIAVAKARRPQQQDATATLHNIMLMFYFLLFFFPVASWADLGCNAALAH